MLRSSLTATAALLAACATSGAPGTSPGDMSVAEHRKEAARHEEASDGHAALAGSPGALDLSEPTSYGTEPLRSGTPLWSGAAARAHAREAGRHAAHARQHRDAAATLASSEVAACREAPASSRATCPLQAGIESIEAIARGIRLHLQPDASLDEVVAGLRCHIARAGTLGHQGMLDCPLYAGTLEVRPVAGQRDVDVIAADPAGVAALQRRITETLP